LFHKYGKIIVYSSCIQKSGADILLLYGVNFRSDMAEFDLLHDCRWCRNTTECNNI